jgi:hypothetical protein
MCKDLLTGTAAPLTQENQELPGFMFFFLPAKVHSLESLFSNLFKLSLRFKYYRALITGTFFFCPTLPTPLHVLFNRSEDTRFFLFLISRRASPAILEIINKKGSSTLKDYVTFASNLKPKYIANIIPSTPLPVFNLFISSLLQIRSTLLFISLILVYL